MFDDLIIEKEEPEGVEEEEPLSDDSCNVYKNWIDYYILGNNDG